MKRTAYLLTACTLVFLSCQKEPDVIPGTVTASNRLKSFTETVTSSVVGNFSTTYNVSYDNSGRIASMVSASSPGDKFVYGFPSASKYTMDIYTGGSLSIHEDFYVNADGFPDSTFQYNDTQDTTTEKYTYNAAKQLVKQKEYAYTKATGGVLSNITTFTYDAGGNLAKSQDTDGEAHTYEYYADLRYALPMVPGPISALTTQRINLMKKHTIESNGFPVGSAQYSYAFDSKDRISTEKAVATDGSTVLRTYTYQ